MRLSIIIPFFNGHEYTKECLASIAENTSGEYEVILVDNGSDQMQRVPTNLNADKYVRLEQNIGFPQGVNAGVSASSGKYICILNNDTIVTPGWADKLLWYIESGLLDMVGPVTNNISGDQQVYLPYYKSKQDLYDRAVKCSEDNYHQFSRLYRLVGFCLVMGREVWDTVGPFDPIYGLGNFEDDELCLKAIEAGYKLGYAHDVFIHHFGSVTHRILGLNYEELLNKNKEVFLSRWQKKIQALIEKNQG